MGVCISVPCEGTLIRRIDSVQVISLEKKTISKNSYNDHVTFKESSLLRSQQEPSESFFFFFFIPITTVLVGWKPQDVESEMVEWKPASIACYIMLTNFELSESQFSHLCNGTKNIYSQMKVPDTLGVH